ncbi:MAG: ABC transporter ATP-binding protein [Lachnospiraceae bacterium]|nr:ABC transporter ATP-binding protein [Lachnospiraceae bacterium]
MKKENVLEIHNLSVSFHRAEGETQAVRDVSLSLRQGEVLALVGESGCGKSVLCKSLIRLLPKGADVKSGSIRMEGKELSQLSEKEMCKLRGEGISMIFQDPLTSLNPTMTIGRQIDETVKLHHPSWKKERRKERVLELLKLVGIEEAGKRYDSYPYQFSGGMRQRCVMAIALACNPKILIADEPTTALDVTIQAEILKQLKEIQQKLGTSILFVTHDLGVVAQIADRVAVMYAGKIVEYGMAEEIFYDARHPYTWGLLHALPYYAKERGGLEIIPGFPPHLTPPPAGDAFAIRDQYALRMDYEQMPPFFAVSETHYAATWLLDERAAEARKLIEERKSRNRSIREEGGNKDKYEEKKEQKEQKKEQEDSP